MEGRDARPVRELDMGVLRLRDVYENLGARSSSPGEMVGKGMETTRGGGRNEVKFRTMARLRRKPLGNP